MMRLTLVTIAAVSMLVPNIALSTAHAQQRQIPEYARGPQPGATGNPAAAVNPAAAQIARAGQAPVAQAVKPPFPPLGPAELAQLQSVLAKWEAQSQGTKTLEGKFRRWHYDAFAAPAGVHATFADGVLKYAAPDKGLFQVENLLFFQGMQDGKPQYAAQDGKFGEWWVCNGEQLFEYDRTKNECRIQDLPPNMRGKNIIQGPLPFVFNLKAREIQDRYWVRQVQAPNPGIVLIEAWPKLQEDRAQYKLVQIALKADSFVPSALIMYAPNFNQKLAPRYDQYEFVDVKRNSIGNSLNRFLGNFIPAKPPANWKILREQYSLSSQPPTQQAAGPDNRR